LRDQELREGSRADGARDLQLPVRWENQSPLSARSAAPTSRSWNTVPYHFSTAQPPAPAPAPACTSSPAHAPSSPRSCSPSRPAAASSAASSGTLRGEAPASSPCPSPSCRTRQTSGRRVHGPAAPACRSSWTRAVRASDVPLREAATRAVPCVRARRGCLPPPPPRQTCRRPRALSARAHGGGRTAPRADRVVLSTPLRACYSKEMCRENELHGPPQVPP
jgi:hypothetical protein